MERTVSRFAGASGVPEQTIAEDADPYVFFKTKTSGSTSMTPTISATIGR